LSKTENLRLREGLHLMELHDKHVNLQGFQQSHYNTIATDNLQQTLDEIENGNLETAETHRNQAFKSFRNGMATYGSTATNQAMKLFDVDSEDDLPEVHQKAVEANKKGHRLVLDMVDNLKPTDGEKPSSDRVDEIRTALEEGEYTVPPLEEFEQALP
ncbi:hypothetical protein SAMN05444271_1713, partial [Halohasta litchfieldiae]